MKGCVILCLISVSLSFCNGFTVENAVIHKWNGNYATSKKYPSLVRNMSLLDDISNIFVPGKDIKGKTNSLVRNQYPKVELPNDFTIPEPKPLTVTNASDVPSLLKSSAALAIRLATSAFVLGWKIDTIFADPEDNSKYSLQIGPFCISDSSSVLINAPRPDKTLVLYEYDSSPYCKRVREMINLLDLTVEYRPCPGARNGKFSKELYEKTGRQTVPYLEDPNTGVGMFESDDIIEYLLDTYGPQDKDSYDRKALWPITFKEFSIWTSTFAALFRGMPGSKRQTNARPDNEDMMSLELWGYECSPFVKPVREKLGELVLPHRVVSCSRGSANRVQLMARTGKKFQVPFLVDPNTGIEMFESSEILKYLDAVYTIKEK